ncbi:MAG: DUF6457 domain-containing protein [Candidatus Dormibacter sp.]
MEAPSNDLLERLAASLAEIAGKPSLAVAVPERAQRAALLRVARDIAHASERQNALLATYLVGRYVGRQRQDGVDEGHTLEEGGSGCT